MFILDGSTGSIYNSLASGALGKNYWETQKARAEDDIASESSKPTSDEEHDHGTQTVTGSNGESTEVAAPAPSSTTSKRDSGKLAEAQARLAEAEYELGKLRADGGQEAQKRNDNRIQATKNDQFT